MFMHFGMSVTSPNVTEELEHVETRVACRTSPRGVECSPESAGIGPREEASPATGNFVPEVVRQGRKDLTLLLPLFPKSLLRRFLGKCPVSPSRIRIEPGRSFRHVKARIDIRTAAAQR